MLHLDTALDILEDNLKAYRMDTLENWLHQPQEQEGSYGFSGSFFVTSGILQVLTQEEIFDIYLFIRQLAKHRNLDYLQVFAHRETGQKLFLIDQLNREMILSGSYQPDDNYCTLLLASEY